MQTLRCIGTQKNISLLIEESFLKANNNTNLFKLAEPIEKNNNNDEEILIQATSSSSSSSSPTSSSLLVFKKKETQNNQEEIKKISNTNNENNDQSSSIIKLCPKELIITKLRNANIEHPFSAKTSKTSNYC